MELHTASTSEGKAFLFLDSRQRDRLRRKQMGFEFRFDNGLGATAEEDA